MASILTREADTNAAVRAYDSGERWAKMLPAEYQLRLIRAMLNGSDLCGIEELDPALSAIDAALEVVRESLETDADAAGDPYFVGAYGFQRPQVAL